MDIDTDDSIGDNSSNDGTGMVEVLHCDSFLEEGPHLHPHYFQESEKNGRCSNRIGIISPILHIKYPNQRYALPKRALQVRVCFPSHG